MEVNLLVTFDSHYSANWYNVTNFNLFLKIYFHYFAYYFSENEKKLGKWVLFNYSFVKNTFLFSSVSYPFISNLTLSTEYHHDS